MVARATPRARRVDPAWLSAFDARARAGRARRVEHVLTHRIFDVRVSRFEARETSAAVELEGYVDVCFDEPSTSTRALSALARKIVVAGADEHDALPQSIPVAERSSKTDVDEARGPARRDRARRSGRTTRAR